MRWWWYPMIVICCAPSPTTSVWWRGAGRRRSTGIWRTTRLLGERRNAQVVPETEPARPAVSRKDQRRQDAERRQQLRPFQQALSKAEAQLERLGKARSGVEAELADSAVYEASSKERLQALLLEKARIGRELEEAEAAWLEAGEALEAAENALID